MMSTKTQQVAAIIIWGLVFVVAFWVIPMEPRSVGQPERETSPEVISEIEAEPDVEVPRGTPGPKFELDQGSDPKNESYYVLNPSAASERLELAIVSIEAHRSVSLHFEQRGTITELNVSSGQAVTAGEVLCRQRPDVLLAQLRSKKAELAAARRQSTNDNMVLAARKQRLHAESEKKTIERLLERNAASLSELADKKLAVQIATYSEGNAGVQQEIALYNCERIEAEIQAISAEIQKRTIYAPFDGQVGLVSVDIGSTIEDEEAMDFLDLSEILVTTIFSVGDLNSSSWWKTGNVVLLNTTTGEKLVGHIELVSEVDMGVALSVQFRFVNEKDGAHWRWLPSGSRQYKLILEKTVGTTPGIALNK